MTQQRRDNKSTEFGIWLRQQKEIDSKLGFVASNVDYVWCDYKKGFWMLIEEKRYRWMPKWSQVKIFRILDAVAKNDINYRGFHILVFENTNPDDGYVWLDGTKIFRDDLLKFLRFENDNYDSYFPPYNLRRLI